MIKISIEILLIIFFLCWCCYFSVNVQMAAILFLLTIRISCQTSDCFCLQMKFFFLKIFWRNRKILCRGIFANVRICEVFYVILPPNLPLVFGYFECQSFLSKNNRIKTNNCFSPSHSP